MELQSELRHALEVPIDEHKDFEMSCESNVKFIMAYVEVGKSRIFKSVCQSNYNPTVSNDQLTRSKAEILYITLKLLIAT